MSKRAEDKNSHSFSFSSKIGYLFTLPINTFLQLLSHPHTSKGVYVAFDSTTKGSSIKSLPGKPPGEFSDGDWMIRVELDHKK